MSVSRVAWYGFFACYGLAYQLSVYIQTAPLSGSAVRQTLDMLFCGRGGMFCDLIKVEPARCIRMILCATCTVKSRSLYRRRLCVYFGFEFSPSLRNAVQLLNMRRNVWNMLYRLAIGGCSKAWGFLSFLLSGFCLSRRLLGLSLRRSLYPHLFRQFIAISLPLHYPTNTSLLSC